MKHNNHSLRIWNLIGRYAGSWNLANWNLFSEKVVNFTIQYGNFHGSISMQEITTVGSPQYGKVAIAFQHKGVGFPNVSFQKPFEAAEFITQLCAISWRDEKVQGERAPKDYPNACSAT